jgi:regulator of sigma E protease
VTFIIAILSFIVALGILVTIHEFGHFWVARKCGVKVLRFSVGFGKPLFKFNRKDDPTDYVVAGIPLGGYVKMLDENEGNVKEDERHLAFNNKPLLSKFLIVLAGPVSNLIFAFIAFWLILMMGEEGLKPVVGGLNESGIAIHSGVEIGDEIIAVNDRPVSIWRVAAGLIATEMLDDGSTEVSLVKTDGQFVKVNFNFKNGEQPEPGEIMQAIGITPSIPAIQPVIGDVVSGEAGFQAGLKSGDLILSVNDRSIKSWREWVELTRASPNKTMNVDVLRQEQLVSLSITPKAIIDDGLTIGRIGVSAFIDKELKKHFYATYSLGLFPAITEAATQTISYSLLTVKLIGKMIIGEASVQNLSGPISLAQYAGETASIGLVSFLKFLAFVSVSLGVINLLPIPMLDGGHLFFYLIEAIKGKPLSDRSQGIFMRVGMLLLMAMMVLAISIDINRLIG